MMTRAPFLLALLAAVSLPAGAQTRLIIGRVDDSLTTRPVETGTVRVLGMPIETPINFDGTFVIYVPVREVTLKIASIGYRAREVRVPVTMQAIQVPILKDYFKMDDVVITGRATGTDRRNLAHSIGEVSSEDLTRVPLSSVDQGLSGRVTGATVKSTGSAPGGGITVQLRGVSSILGNVEPLWVVDGVIVSNAAIPGGANAITRGQAGVIASSQENPVNRIADLNPNDIERIEVLKGAAASTMYGSRGSNGVVLITTKRGRFQN